jgi:hypothetical protein
VALLWLFKAQMVANHRTPLPPGDLAGGAAPGGRGGPQAHKGGRLRDRSEAEGGRGGRHVPREVSAVEQQPSMFSEPALERLGGPARLSISFAP